MPVHQSQLLAVRLLQLSHPVCPIPRLGFLAGLAYHLLIDRDKKAP
ncbi:hypothetical protein GCM10009530_45760 [Microbispora corallina]|uniref:Uncharacterized protein n=1 Tax=Microbispora corallina TaxID=83302 RepID=A0ABQ4FWK6_9ACTN|nr:hypothetical protein [Microbispora corallina]GIH39165.1 hypothetical protein Mco01_21650 [Microbispora corallina]